EHLEKHARRATKVRDGLPTHVPVAPELASQIAACTTACQRLLDSAQVPTEAEVLAERPETASTAPVVLEQLLDAVLKNPDDDRARSVYADALLDAGDPRGEFIALQLESAREGRLSSTAEKRERELIRAHGRA